MECDAATTEATLFGRNGGRGCYRAAASDRQAWRRALRLKPCKLATHPQLRRVACHGQSGPADARQDPSRDTQTVVKALIKQAKQLPDELYKSLTWDRGFELADHKRFTMATDIAVYFCDPQSPRQRGSNENTNRLLRQYFPRGTDLSVHSQARLNRVAREVNERPRKTLGRRSTRG